MGDRVDVIVVGAGAGGAVASLHLARNGFSVVCLEQGSWHTRDEFPGNRTDWELQSSRRWSSVPHLRARVADYPIDTSQSSAGILNFNGVGGGRFSTTRSGHGCSRRTSEFVRSMELQRIGP